MTFVVEDGTANPLATSYCSVAHADMHHSARGTGRWWSGLGEDEKRYALRIASVGLDATVAWPGYPSVPGQGRGWPRRDAVDRQGVAIPPNVVPRAVARAAAELAFRLVFVPPCPGRPAGLPENVYRMVADLGYRIRGACPDLGAALDAPGPDLDRILGPDLGADLDHIFGGA
jgi:hypothetical protein